MSKRGERNASDPDLVITRIPADADRLALMREVLVRLALAHLEARRAALTPDAPESQGPSATGAA